MSNLTNINAIPPSSLNSIDLVRKIESIANKMEQVDIETKHVIHKGIYTRTICIPAGVLITGALIKVATTLIVSGKCLLMVGDGHEMLVDGYSVFPAAAGRKQVILAYDDTYLSLSFKTKAKTVKEAESELTDEVELLKSNINANQVVITED